MRDPAFRLSRSRELRLRLVADPRGGNEEVLEFRLWRQCERGREWRPTPVAFFLPLRLVVPVARAAIDVSRTTSTLRSWSPAQASRAAS
jgi:hypothetical protein